jgi:hypothetical protein
MTYEHVRYGYIKISQNVVDAKECGSILVWMIKRAKAMTT